MTDEAKALLRKHEPIVVEHIREWRERWEASEKRNKEKGRTRYHCQFPAGPPWPADAPCYYCDADKELCKICIHNDQALIWRLADD